MATFFENLGKKAGEAVKKSGELVEITKINMNISSEEGKIQKIYTQIGKKVYESFCSTGETNEDFAEDCNAIKEHEKTIAELKEKIMELKNIKICTGCGAEMDRAAMFCAKCGAKQEVPQPVQPEAASSKACPSCGASVPEDSAFCTSCGAKME
jgi:ribosomal protein L40E